MNARFLALLLAACAVVAPACAAPATVSRIDAVQAPASSAPLAIGGRAIAIHGSADLVYQWPGSYFETAFEGRRIDFRLGPGTTILHVRVDDAQVGLLETPAPGLYRIEGLADAAHRVRIETATESQAGPNRFGGFFLPPGSSALAVAPRPRRIEFIGDSHTVGYGTLSSQRECSEAQVWATTDNTRAFGPRVARHYGADYRVNAISGRGVVRNYGGLAADTLPQAYPYVLFDRSVPVEEDRWQPQLVVIALGTNDFSTPLASSERWENRQALHADYERTYVAFVQSLRSRYPDARFVLWATDLVEGEIRSEVERVVAVLRDAGETRISFLPAPGLQMSGCHGHPSLDDHARIADALVAHIDALADAWKE